MTKQHFIENSPIIVCTAAGILVVWHFFIRRWIEIILYHFGFLRYSSYEDEKRGMNEHIRLLRRNFKRMQKIKRKCYYRLVPNKDGSIISSIVNNRNMYRLQCLETGEIKEMNEDWLLEALHFKIISNADNISGKISLVDDVNKEPIPEYNKKVGDISYFNLIIGAYSDWSAVQMDMEAVTSDFYK